MSDEQRATPASIELNGGTRERVGELRGEVRALTREVQGLRQDYCDLRASIDGLRGEMQIHLAAHKLREEDQHEETTEKRMRRQLWVQLMAAGIGALFGVVFTLLARGLHL